MTEKIPPYFLGAVGSFLVPINWKTGPRGGCHGNPYRDADRPRAGDLERDPGQLSLF